MGVPETFQGQEGGRVGAVVSAITRHIRDNALMPGDRLPSEIALSKELNVSRPVVREAFRSLAAMHIIELATGRRATVAPLDHGPIALVIEHGVHIEQINVLQIYDVRRAIEGRIVALAALRRSEAEARTIQDHARAMREAATAEAVMEADLAFHTALAAAARNSVFALLVGAFQQITRTTWPIGWRSRTTAAMRTRMLETHREIADAVAASDPVEAERQMALHFDESARTLIAAGLS